MPDFQSAMCEVSIPSSQAALVGLQIRNALINSKPSAAKITIKKFFKIAVMEVLPDSQPNKITTVAQSTESPKT